MVSGKTVTISRIVTKFSVTKSRIHSKLRIKSFVENSTSGSPTYATLCELMHQKAFSLSLTHDGIPILSIPYLFKSDTKKVNNFH